jgi:Probable lipoprotein LpqN
MTKRLRVGGVAIAAAALGLALAGCGSEEKKTEATTSQEATSAAAPAAPVQPAGPNKTIVDYIKENGIGEAPVRRGDPGTPVVNMPIPPGWTDVGPKTPPWAWGMMVSADPATAADPPSMTLLMSKLTGPVDPAKIMEFAPGEIKNLPEYSGDGVGSASTLGGFEAWQVGGTYVKNGVRRAIAQKTVNIPGQDALYVFQLNADAPEPQLGALIDATNVIDQNTTITP